MRHHAGLMCHVESLHYDFLKRVGELHFPDGDCCDMQGAINVFLLIDPAIREIKTFSGGQPDTFYKKVQGQWQAWLEDTRSC